MIRLIFDSIHNGSALGQLGGSVPLPETISWPTDIDGKPMLHLLTLHIDALTQISPINLPNDNVVSIFIPYDHLYKDHVPLLRPTRLSKGAKVLAFKPGRNFINRNEHPLDPPLNINFEKTSKLIGKEIAIDLKNKNISTCWTHIPNTKGIEDIKLEVNRIKDHSVPRVEANKILELKNCPIDKDGYCPYEKFDNIIKDIVKNN